MRRSSAVRVVGPAQWILAPALIAVAATLVFAIPLRMFGLRLPEFVWPMVLAFAWPIIRPSMLAPVVLALLGLFLDLFWGGPIGLWATSLLAIYLVILLSRNILIGQSTIVLFLWYVLAVLLAFACAYGITAAVAHNAPSLYATAGQMVPTMLLFPLAARLIERLDDGDVRFR